MRLTNTPFRLVHAAALTLVLAGTSTVALAQNVFDDFSSGNDNAWLRVDAPGITFGRPSSYAVTGGAYRIGTPANSAGFAAYSFRPDAVAIDSQISVDILNWDPNVGTFAAITGRAFQNAQGGLQYYTVAFLSRSITYPGQSNLAIYRDNGDGTIDSLAGTDPFALATPGQSFRLVMTLSGATISGEIFDLATGSSIRSQSFTDTSSRAILGPGGPGLAVATFTPTGANEATFATFDNFRVIPAPGAAAMLALGGLLASRRRR